MTPQWSIRLLKPARLPRTRTSSCWSAAREQPTARPDAELQALRARVAELEAQLAAQAPATNALVAGRRRSSTGSSAGTST